MRRAYPAPDRIDRGPRLVTHNMLDLDPTTVRSIDAAEEVRTALLKRARTVLQARAGGPWIARVTVPVPGPARPIDWMRAQDCSEATYWSGRTDDRTVAAIGAADVLASSSAPVDYDALHDRLTGRLGRADSAIRYYGGLRFDAAQPSSPNHPDRRWAPFGTYRFVLPRFELLNADGARRLACNLVLPRDAAHADAIAADIDTLAFPMPTDPAPLPRPYHRQDAPVQEEWTQMIRWALDAIDGGALDKVVLARRVALALDDPMDPLLVLRHLEAATPGCYHFATRPAEGPVFMGASPERLFRREGECVAGEAVAGTRTRGETAAEDEALREELLASPKERREHAFVQDAIQADLEGVCTSVQAPEEPEDLALARGRHLYSRIDGTLRADTSTADLLEVLHPTPAVGGVPTEDAVAAIRAQEPFDRGWYAGPMGWIGAEAAEFAVGLRAGLAWKNRVALFSGAGIVDGSEPRREWDEIEQKIGDFAAIMGVTGS